ncbi:unnamed protein product [Trifolium pratense]|uniref:Uncharacterized protein n=1 Tax=Trifolium pratense TaxID=57577 RepID=A0ACB0L6I6_TRIPR|nr:unnamed protein product [Trifolium pratense]
MRLKYCIVSSRYWVPRIQIVIVLQPTFFNVLIEKHVTLVHADTCTVQTVLVTKLMERTNLKPKINVRDQIET